MTAQPQPCTLQDNIEAYKAMMKMLTKRAWGEWVVFHNRELIKNGREIGFETFEAALQAASPFLVGSSSSTLIKRVGEEVFIRPNGHPDMRLPANPNWWPRLMRTIRHFTHT